MGVKGLWPILQPTAKHTLLHELAGLRVAVDLAIWVVDDIQTQREAACAIPGRLYLRNLFFRVAHLLKLGVKLLFVVDGEAPLLKVPTMTQRAKRDCQHSASRRPICAERRRKRQHFRRLLGECCRLLQLIGVPCVESPGEAESMAALLNRRGIVDVVVTNDGDAFLYGAVRVLRNFGMNAKDAHVDWYDAGRIAEQLGLTRDRLVALGLLLGCDFTPGVAGVGRESALRLLRSIPPSSDALNCLAELGASASGQSQPKGPHCSRCTHAGRKAEHSIAGCSQCGTSVGCSANAGKCECAYHSSVNCRQLDSLRRRLASSAPANFPDADVVREFLFVNCEWHLPIGADDIRWIRPQPLQFVQFCVAKLEWEEKYAIAKLAALAAHWQLSEGVNEPALMTPTRILAERVRDRLACYEMEFARFSFDEWTDGDCYAQCLPRSLVDSSLPRLVTQFREARAKEKEAKRENKRKNARKGQEKKENAGGKAEEKKENAGGKAEEKKENAGGKAEEKKENAGGKAEVARRRPKEEKSKKAKRVDEIFPQTQAPRTVLVEQLADLFNDISLAGASSPCRSSAQPQAFAGLFNFRRCPLTPVGRFSIETSLLATDSRLATDVDNDKEAERVDNEDNDSFDQFRTPPKLMARLYDVDISR